MTRVALALVLMVAACGDDAAPGELTLQRVAAGGRVGHSFLTATELAIQAATGHREVADVRLAVPMRQPVAPAARSRAAIAG